MTRGKAVQSNLWPQMRFLVVQSWYPSFLDAHYRARPGLAERPYREQWESLMASSFSASDSYSTSLRALGHEADEVIVNCRPLQERWAAENGLPLRRRLRPGIRPDWQEEIALAQVEAFRPDIVHVDLLTPLLPATVDRFSALAALVVGQIATFRPPADHLDPYGLIITSFPHFVPAFQAEGRRSAYLPLAFDPRVLDRLPAATEEYDGVFVGGLGRAWHGKGNDLLEVAARSLPIDFWGYGAESWPDDSPLRKRYHGEAWGLDMYQVFRSAKIGLNRHIDAAAGHANNLRLYDTTGVGCCLLTDAGSNLAELFEPGREVITYRDSNDLEAKLRHYLADDDARREIASAGQRRTLADHSWPVRMGQYVDIVSGYAS